MNMEKMKELYAEKEIRVRFSEVDAMGVVWHGSYALYLEDARELFGEKFGLSYDRYFREKVFVPIVELKYNFRHPLVYGMGAVVRIKYRPTEAAKIIFDYEILNPADGTVYLTATSVQVFMDREYRLLWDSPDFYVKWKEEMGV